MVSVMRMQGKDARFEQVVIEYFMKYIELKKLLSSVPSALFSLMSQAEINLVLAVMRFMPTYFVRNFESTI